MSHRGEADENGGRQCASRGRIVLAALLAATALAPPAAASPGQDYILYCMGCHGEAAQGVPGKVPPLAGALARFMRTSVGRNYVLRVPGAANSALSDAQLAAVLNWLAARFSPPADARPEPFTVREVSEVRRMPLAAVQAKRREVVRALGASGAAPASTY